MPQAGAEVGRFVLRAPLGQGAQASVWRAHDPQLDRDVALKLFHEGAEDELGSDWRDEARLTGGLQHPGIVSVHDLLEQDGRPVIVSECVPGQTLAERLRAGALPAPEAVRVLREARALIGEVNLGATAIGTGITAAEVLNTYSVKDLSRLLSARIAPLLPLLRLRPAA